MFIDKVVIQLKAGKGGNGIVAWRREKYLPKGGPYGGDGGKGGNVVILADSQIYCFEHYRNTRILKAEKGVSGGPNNRKGKVGRDLFIKVPLGTIVRDDVSKEIIYDFTKQGEYKLVCLGGKGGRGNTSFKSSRNRAPNTATPGTLGEEKTLEFELKLIADIGLVGFPNSGKSTLLKKMTSVDVKIAPYPFTTLKPSLGLFAKNFYDKNIFIADIPGIILGAHKNKGLGFNFLRHIERTNILLFVVDVSCFERSKPLEDLKTLFNELRHYDSDLLEKPRIIALNKIDLYEERKDLEKLLKQFKKCYPKETFISISGEIGEGIPLLQDLLKDKLKRYSAPDKLAIVGPTGQFK